MPGFNEIIFSGVVLVAMFFLGKKISPKMADQGIESAKAWKKNWNRFKKGMSEVNTESADEDDQ